MSFSTYESVYVFDLFPYWVKPPSAGYFRSLEEFGDLGRTYAQSFMDHPKYKTTFKIACNGKDKIAEVNALFDDRKGRKGALWFPSWRENIELFANISAVSTTINIEDIEYSSYYTTDPGTGRYIFIYVNRSEWYVRKVTGFPGAEWIDIDSALGVAVTKARCKMICFLYYGHFDNDEIEWEYISPDVAITELSFIESPEEYPAV